jgi:hypothetical protein
VSTRTPPERTQKAFQARIRIGIDRRITELLAVAPQFTDEQRERISAILAGGQR